MADTELYLFWREGNEIDEKCCLQEASGLVIKAGAITPGERAAIPTAVTVLEDGDPACHEEWCQRENALWTAEDELDSIASQRDSWPHLSWLPRINLYRPEVGYDFNDHTLGEGFKFYVPDTSTIQAYRTLASDQPLEALLQRAQELGFETLWIHATDAELSGRGFDLDLLERATSLYKGRLWISGGGTEEQHLVNLAREGGAAAVVVSSELAYRFGCDRLNLALATGEERGTPVVFEKRVDNARPGPA